MNHRQLVHCIMKARPGAKFALTGETLDGLEWIPGQGQEPPSLAECEAYLAEADVEIQAEDKNHSARQIVNQEKILQAVVQLVLFVGQDPQAPQKLKDLRTQILAIANDIKETD